jgi:hypothetical protein
MEGAGKLQDEDGAETPRTEEPKKKSKDKDEAKAGHKSLRVRRRVQFAVEFWAEWLGANDTTFIETSVDEKAKRLAKEHGIAWARLYHPHSAVRWLRTYLIEDYPLKDAHEARRAFVMEHKDFFFLSRNGELVVDTRKAIAIFGSDRNDDGKEDEQAMFERFDVIRLARGDAYEAGRLLAAKLKSRGIEPPKWPPVDSEREQGELPT